MKYSGHRKLLCELSKLSKFNAVILLGYQTNTDASILVYKFRPERTGFNIYAEYTRPQLVLWLGHTLRMDQDRITKMALRWTHQGRRKKNLAKKRE